MLDRRYFFRFFLVSVIPLTISYSLADHGYVSWAVSIAYFTGVIAEHLYQERKDA